MLWFEWDADRCTIRFLFLRFLEREMGACLCRPSLLSTYFHGLKSRLRLALFGKLEALVERPRHSPPHGVALTEFSFHMTNTLQKFFDLHEARLFAQLTGEDSINESNLVRKFSSERFGLTNPMISTWHSLRTYGFLRSFVWRIRLRRPRHRSIQHRPLYW